MINAFWWLITVVLVYNIYEMNRPSPDDMKAMQVMKYVEELEKENERLQNFVDDLLDKMNNIKIVYVEFEKAETEYDKKLAVLDKLIMNR